VRPHLSARFVLTWLVPVAAAWVAASRNLTLGDDGALFVRAGRTLLSSHWNHAFAVPTVQAGPVQLALFGSLGRSGWALSLVLATGIVLLVVAAARRVGVESPALLCGVGVLAAATGLTGVGYTWGHPADAVLPLLWIFAAAEARRGRALRAGLIVGLSAGLETWGTLGVAVLALAPSRRQAGAGALVAAGVALALFLPFMLGGHFEMWSFRWFVYRPSPMSMLVAPGTQYGWPLRLAQGALAVGAGVAVARLLRHSPHALWAVPLAIVAAKLLLDPDLYSYYLAAPQGPIFVGAALGASRLGRRSWAPAMIR
jgi:hypothetical protein